jgi:hypothetical protein
MPGYLWTQALPKKCPPRPMVKEKKRLRPTQGSPPGYILIASDEKDKELSGRILSQKRMKETEDTLPA